jgi:hypothetical protein
MSYRGSLSGCCKKEENVAPAVNPSPVFQSATAHFNEVLNLKSVFAKLSLSQATYFKCSLFMVDIYVYFFPFLILQLK